MACLNFALGEEPPGALLAESLRNEAAQTHLIYLIVRKNSMPRIEIDFDPVSHITTDAIGGPGKRVFYLQAWQENKSAAVIVEKVQIQSLALGLDQFLEEVNSKHENLSESSDEFQEEKMHIQPPLDPLFHAGEMGLAYDAERDLIILVVKEITSGEQESEEAGVIRFWCTRSQMRALCAWGLEVAGRGRPLCPQCGEPMEPEGHFCPKKNGHKH